MTQSITALDLIRRSMYLINAVAAGESISAQDANDALLTLNEMIDSWSTETLAVYGSANDEFTIVPGKQVYTYGIGGDFNVQRPIWLEDAYFVRQGVTTPVKIITVDEFNGITIKSQSQPLVERIFFSNSYPLATVSMWPIPSEANIIGFTTNRVLTNISSLTDLISLPPGYLRALRHCLAVELWPEYSNPTTDINSIRAVAIKAKANIKSANASDVVSSFEDVPKVEAGRSWDWRGG